MSRENEIKKIINDLIERQAEILGPEIAILKATEVSGLKLTKEGQVARITGGNKRVLQDLINVYLELSGPVVYRTIEPLLKKYPDLSAGLV